MKRAGSTMLVLVAWWIASSCGFAAGLKIAPRPPASPKAEVSSPQAESSSPRVPASGESPKPDQFPNEGEAAAWSIAGTWHVTHPAWSEDVTIGEGGDVSRANGEQGHWSLTAEQGTIILVLKWPKSVAERAVMIDGDCFRGRIDAGLIEIRRNRGKGVTGAETSGETAKGANLVILSAMYGVDDHRVDVTPELRAKIRDGRLDLPAHWQMGEGDGGTKKPKDIVIQYRDVTGRSRTARFKEEEPLVLPKE